jgi:hypothetical protein
MMTSTRLASTTADPVPCLECGDGTAMTDNSLPRVPSRDQRQARRNPHSHNNIHARNTLQHKAIGLPRTTEPTHQALILNTANTEAHILTGQEGGYLYQQTTIRTSLRLWQFIAKRFGSNMFRCATTLFARGPRVKSQATHGF